MRSALIVLCFVLPRTNSYFCHLHIKLIGFYNRDEKCLPRGAKWVIKYSSLLSVFKWLIYHKIIVVQRSILYSWQWHVTKKRHKKCIVVSTAKWLRDRATKLHCVYLAYLVGMWRCLAFQELTILWCNTLSLIVQLKERLLLFPENGAALSSEASQISPWPQSPHRRRQ